MAFETETAAAACGAPGGDGARVVRLTIPAKAEYVTLCRLALTGLAGVHHVSGETLADLKLALTEACSNSVRHAYTDGAGAIEILYELRPDRLAIEVGDDGVGFDPQASAGVQDNPAESGLGIAVIRAIADELEIGERENGRGSRLRFVKLLPG